MKSHLMLPGPTPVPERVLSAMSRPMINHRGEEFAGLLREVTAGLQYVFQTAEEPVVLPAAGTGGLEAAVVNTLSPGDRVLALVTGAFGERFAAIARAFGVQVEALAASAGRAVDLEALRARLEQDLERPAAERFRGVLVTHNETSTGVTNPIEEIAPLVRRHGALLLVDAISSLGAVDLPFDRLGLDVAVSGSQKALMCPPGLAVLALSRRAWQAAETARGPRFYFDLRSYRKAAAKAQTPYTPALSLLYGLRESLAMIREEGLEEGFRRHALLGRMIRAGIQALGLDLLADPRHSSATVTAVMGTKGIDLKALRRHASEVSGVTLAGGQGELADSIFRIGHLGHVGPADVLAALVAVGDALAAQGWAGPAGSDQAVAAAMRVLTEERGRKA